MFLFHAGEEEDGDEDDEAEGATGKRAAEDDEVGRMAIPLEPPVSSEGLGRVSAGPERPGWALGLERPAHAFPFPCLSRDTSHFHLYPGLVRGGACSGCAEPLALGWGAPGCSGQAGVGVPGLATREGFARGGETLVLCFCPCPWGGRGDPKQSPASLPALVWLSPDPPAAPLPVPSPDGSAFPSG